MTSMTAPQSLNHRAAIAFEQYISGRPSPEKGIVFFLESAEHFDEVRRIAAPADILIAPEEARSHDEYEAHIGYAGVFLEPGDEMTLNGRHTFELQDYLAAPFISIVGLTLVRLGSVAGLSAFLQDAESARRDGVYVDQLLSSAVLIDGRDSFVSGPAETRLVRVHVNAGGEYRDGPDGLLLGRLGDDRAVLQAAADAGAGVGRAFARIVAPNDFEAELAARPWLGRYVRVLDLIRQWEGSHAGVTVSGFGGHLVAALDDPSSDHAILAPDAPFIVREGGNDYVLVDRPSRRRFRLGLDAARIAEALVATRGEEEAVALLAASGVSAKSMRASVREVRKRFLSVGVDLVTFSGRTV